MALNLITDKWIPVVNASGDRRTIAPWEMADPSVERPDWPRADLNVACLELLIGLVYLADPPEDIDDWEDRKSPDQDRLKRKLLPYAEAFNLTGEGPLFQQDWDSLGDEKIEPVDRLFIDSAGVNTAKKNADVLVHRDRYDQLSLPLAAMALFTLQAHAPGGGAGNRTSLRGGGPMVTLIDPRQGLWSIVWANVPFGQASSVSELPWMRRTVSSSTGIEVGPPKGSVFSVEAFFGQPRRLRLEADGEAIFGVRQKTYGNNYAGWKHPLSPHYQQNAGSTLLPVHPKTGSFSYRNWDGVIAKMDKGLLRYRANCVEGWLERSSATPATIIVAGWATKNSLPRDFIYSEQPFTNLTDKQWAVVLGVVQAAELACFTFRGALKSLSADGEFLENQRDQFFLATHFSFLRLVDDLYGGVDPSIIQDKWAKLIRSECLERFDKASLPSLSARNVLDIEKVVSARRNLRLTLMGYGKRGTEIFRALALELPSSKGAAA